MVYKGVRNRSVSSKSGMRWFIRGLEIGVCPPRVVVGGGKGVRDRSVCPPKVVGGGKGDRDGSVSSEW